MIATLVVYGVVLVAIAGVARFFAGVVVRLLDPFIGYRPEREDPRGVPWPDDLPEHHRPLVAVGPGRPHHVAHRLEAHR